MSMEPNAGYNSSIKSSDLPFGNLPSSAESIKSKEDLFQPQVTILTGTPAVQSPIIMKIEAIAQQISHPALGNLDLIPEHDKAVHDELAQLKEKPLSAEEDADHEQVQPEEIDPGIDPDLNLSDEELEKEAALLQKELDAAVQPKLNSSALDQGPEVEALRENITLNKQKLDQQNQIVKQENGIAKTYDQEVQTKEALIRDKEIIIKDKTELTSTKEKIAKFEATISQAQQNKHRIEHSKVLSHRNIAHTKKTEAAELANINKIYKTRARTISQNILPINSFKMIHQSYDAGYSLRHQAFHNVIKVARTTPHKIIEHLENNAPEINHLLASNSNPKHLPDDFFVLERTLENGDRELIVPPHLAHKYRSNTIIEDGREINIKVQVMEQAQYEAMAEEFSLFVTELNMIYTALDEIKNEIAEELVHSDEQIIQQADHKKINFISRHPQLAIAVKFLKNITSEKMFESLLEMTRKFDKKMLEAFIKQIEHEFNLRQEYFKKEAIKSQRKEIETRSTEIVEKQRKEIQLKNPEQLSRFNNFVNDLYILKGKKP